MVNKKDKINKIWDELTTAQRRTTSLVFRQTLLNCYLIPSNTETELIYNYLEQNRPSVSLSLVNNVETVQNVNESYLMALIKKTQNDLFNENGYAFHEEYLVKFPKVVGLEEIFKAKGLKSK